MNSPQSDWLDSYLEDTPPRAKTHYGQLALISACIHLAFLFVVIPQIDFSQLNIQEKETRLVFNLSLDEETEAAKTSSEVQENQNQTITDTEASLAKKDFGEESPIEEISKNESQEPPQIFEAITSVAREQSLSSESTQNSNLDDPEYSGNIFDPRLREKLIESQARTKRLAFVAKPEPYSYIDNSGSEVIVNGDTCYKGTELDEFSGTVWSLPYRCPWVKSLSEKMIANVNEAMRYRFGR